MAAQYRISFDEHPDFVFVSKVCDLRQQLEYVFRYFSLAKPNKAISEDMKSVRGKYL
jgi:hypothetical protein